MCESWQFFFHFFSPQFPHWKSWSKFSMSIFRTTNPCGPNFFLPNFGVFLGILRLPKKLGRNLVDSPWVSAGIGSPQLQTLWFSPLWVVALAASEAYNFFVFLEGLDSPMLHNSYWGRQYKKQYTNDKFTGSRKTIFWMVCPKRLLFW